MRRFNALVALPATLALFIVLALAKISGPVHAQQATSPRATSVAGTVVAGGAQFSDVRGLAVDAGGNLFVSLSASPAPANCISRETSRRLGLTIFSNCASLRAEDPSGVAVTPEGRVYLANRQQNAIRLLDMLTGKVAVVPHAAATAKTAPPNPNASANALKLSEPAGLATDRAGDLFVADRGNNRIVALAPGAGDFVEVAHVLDAAAVAADPAGANVYIASPASNRIYRVELATSDISVFAGTGALPDSNPARFPAPIPPASAMLAAPEGVATDAAGNLYIADTGANAILRGDMKAGLLTRVALASELNSPTALAIDRRGNLFVADRGDHRILEFAGVAAQQTTPAVTISPSPFDFGDQLTGGTTPAQTFTLTNNSSSALSFVSTDFSFTGTDPNDFMQTNNCVGGQSVAANGGTCQIFVTFAPQGAGPRSATLQVSDADPSSPQTTNLSGTGDDFQITAQTTNGTIANVNPGSSGNYSLQIMPDNTFSGTVTLSCPTQLPESSLTCSTNVPSVSVTMGTAAPFTVTIGTQSPNTTPASAPTPREMPPTGMIILVALLAALAAIARRGMAATGRPSSLPARARAGFATFALALLATLAVAGCYHRPASYNPNGTPAGIYKINIIATSQNASRSITLTLNVA